MKLTENDYSAETGKLKKADGTIYSIIENIVIKNKNEFQNLSEDSLSTEILYNVTFPAEFAGNEQDGFDECFLAELRNFLKLLEPEEKTVIINLQCNENLKNNKELTLELFYHIARRIKDCVSVAGFTLPDFPPAAESAAMQENLSFPQKVIETLQKKHPEYVYFVRSQQQYEQLHSVYPARIALY